jgi:hypothetical protein
MTAKDYRIECEARRGGITEMEGRLCDDLAEREHDIAELTAAVKETEPKLLALVQAARAYRDLCTCYRIGARPSERLFDSIEKARQALAPFEGVDTK